MATSAKKTNIRTYTNVGKENGYDKTSIDLAIDRQRWEPFRTQDLPFMQGKALQEVIKECRIPVSKITKMALHGCYGDSLGFYGLEVNYANGTAQIYMVDDGCACCIVASDFQENEIN